MSEKKYIDHKKFNSKLNYIIRAYGFSGVISEKIKKAITDSLAADVVEVVRCKDCKYFQTAKVNNKGFLICPASGMEITETDYCSYGERKEADNDKQKT